MSPWIDIAGRALLHFVWQGALAWCFAGAALRLLRGASPHVRYVTACAVMAGMLAMPVVTARVLVHARSTEPTPAAIPATASDAFGIAMAPPMAPPPPSVAALQPPAVAAVAPVARSVQLTGLLPFVVFAWLAGVAFLLARMAGGWARVHSLHRISVHALPSRWERSCSRLAVLLGIERLVRVVDSPFVDTPTVIGWFRPVILLPIAALANLSPSQVEAILAHELAHVRRHDYAVNLLQSIAETLLFYHPAVWWISGRIRAEREHCCDLVAVSVCGDAVSYAEALAELETWRTTDGTLAVAATGGSLLDRIRRVLGVPADDGPRLQGAASIAAIAIAFAVTAGATHLLRAAPAESRQDDGSIETRRAVEGAVSWKMLFRHDSGELVMLGYTARDLIRFAYGIPDARVLGGPAWLEEETDPILVDVSEVLAALPDSDAAIGRLLDPPAADQMPDVVRRALEDRFRLQVHLETRDLPALALTMARPDRSLGPNLRVSTIDCFHLQAWIAAGHPPREPRPNAQRQPVCGEEAWESTMGRTSWVAITMPQLAYEMRGFTRLAARARGTEPLDVIDSTGLTGKYDVDFEAFLPATALMARFPAFKVLLEPLGFPSRERALEQQLGLSLVETTAPYDVIVIDHVERPAG